jgi:hypothetical protein
MGRAQRSTFSPAEQKRSVNSPPLFTVSISSNIGFDRQLVTQSKINKEIRKLSKQIKIVHSKWQQSRVDAITHPCQVFASSSSTALNDLCAGEPNKLKHAGPDSSTPTADPRRLKDTQLTD